MMFFLLIKLTLIESIAPKFFISGPNRNFCGSLQYVNWLAEKVSTLLMILG